MIRQYQVRLTTHPKKYRASMIMQVDMVAEREAA